MDFFRSLGSAIGSAVGRVTGFAGDQIRRLRSDAYIGNGDSAEDTAAYNQRPRAESVAPESAGFGLQSEFLTIGSAGAPAAGPHWWALSVDKVPRWLNPAGPSNGYTVPRAQLAVRPAAAFQAAVAQMYAGATAYHVCHAATGRIGSELCGPTDSASLRGCVQPGEEQLFHAPIRNVAAIHREREARCFGWFVIQAARRGEERSRGVPVDLEIAAAYVDAADRIDPMFTVGEALFALRTVDLGGLGLASYAGRLADPSACAQVAEDAWAKIRPFVLSRGYTDALLVLACPIARFATDVDSHLHRGTLVRHEAELLEIAQYLSSRPAELEAAVTMHLRFLSFTGIDMASLAAGCEADARTGLSSGVWTHGGHGGGLSESGPVCYHGFVVCKGGPRGLVPGPIPPGGTDRALCVGVPGPPGARVHAGHDGPREPRSVCILYSPESVHQGRVSGDLAVVGHGRLDTVCTRPSSERWSRGHDGYSKAEDRVSRRAPGARRMDSRCAGHGALRDSRLLGAPHGIG
jgi:hypothetical protein